MRAAILIAVWSCFACFACFACRDPGRSDTGVIDPGIMDAEPRETGPLDGGPDADIDDDGGTYDGGERDGSLIDGGSGLYCEEALLWPAIDVPLVGTTSAAVHHDRFECAGLGGGAIAPERWIETEFATPTHAIVRLGTGGWDAVMSVRTSTCAPLGEIACLDAPTIVELPVALGRVFFGVDGFTDGSGPFVLTGELGPPLIVPPTDSICTVPPPDALPVSRIAHNFGADPSAAIAGCALEAPIFVPVDLAADGELSIRIEPQAGQDLSLALLSECDATIACSARGTAGFAETLSRVSLTAGRYTLAIGSPPAATQGSFLVQAAVDAECVEDADCEMGDRCGSDLTCTPVAPGSSAVSAGIEIPDAARIEIPLLLAGPTSRPARVRLRLAIAHEFPEDLVVTLAAPGGWPRVRLRDRLDGAMDSVYGKDRPADGPGTMFDFGLAATATGTWTLEVEDRAPGDVGRVTGAVLEVE